MYIASHDLQPVTAVGAAGCPTGPTHPHGADSRARQASTGALSSQASTTAQQCEVAWRWVRLVALCAVLLAVWALVTPTRFGGSMTYAVVTGHSMEPVMHDGALAVARGRGSYQLGQTVIYDRLGGHVMHRLVLYEPGHGWVTRGDNNDWVDGWFVPEQNIRGQVLFTIPAVGGWLRNAARHPLQLVGFATVVAGIGALPRKRRCVTPELARALEAAVPEPVPVALRSDRGPRVISACAMVLAVLAALTTLVRQAPLWPTQAVAFGALLMCVVGFDVLQTVAQDAWGTPEPDRSTLVLAPVSRRVYAKYPPGTSVTPGRAPLAVRSAAELRDLSQIYRLPVLHRVDAERGHRDYVLITRRRDYVWVPPGQPR